MKATTWRLVLSVVCLVAWMQTVTQERTTGSLFDRTEAMIPMRDGIRLQTAIFIPKQASEPLPFLFTRTPYGIPENEKKITDPGTTLSSLSQDGYIFVFQNIRGRFKSEGQFVMLRPLRDRQDPKSIDEASDAYDTIEWLLKNVPNNNGQVGMWGNSYAGWTTLMSLTNPHPALRAVSEQASPADMFVGDDFHHNGAFRLSYGLEYSAMVEAEKESNFHFKFDTYDTYEWYLRLGALSNVNRDYFLGKIPTWNDFVEHPNRDEFWKGQTSEFFLHNTTVPNLNVAGWWDQEDFYGPIKNYELLEKNDVSHINYLVVGPWNHGGWSSGTGDHLGNIPFASNTGVYFRSDVIVPWFAYWLHHKGKLTEPEVLTFQTGSNTWKSYDSWPPRNSHPTRLYFRSDRHLSFDAPARAGENAFDSYISDPANPVPYRTRPITPTYPGPEWPVWLTQDQRFADHRTDVLSWETDPLQDDVVITGDIVADLFASTSGSDSDWVVKLIDVYPEDFNATVAMANQSESDRVSLDGYQLMIASEVFRARFRNSYEQPEAVVPNRVTEYRIDLHTNDHSFKKGHKIMVQVQSTWFPLIDRNPQKFVPNIFKAQDSDYVKATQRIFRSTLHASSIILPVQE
jgi:uncharacterized protein